MDRLAAVSDVMPLVEQHIIRRTDKRFAVLDKACFFAKNIYNAANYQRRQVFFEDGRCLSYETQEQCFKQHHLLPDQQLPMKVVQQVLKGLHNDWSGFVAARAAYNTSPDKFTGRPRLPQYKDKQTGRYALTFTEQAISKRALAQGAIVLSGLNVCIKTRQRHIQQVRVVPRSSHYVVEVVYSVPIRQVDYQWLAGVDIGLDNLAALTSNKPGFVPFLVNGSPLKALNQHYNKCRADLMCQLPAGQYTSRRLQALTDKRNRRLDALLHLASRYIIAVLLRESIGTLVIGKNDGWKQHIALGKRTNQNFVSIPHARFIKMLTYKAALVGIHVVVVEESYTSKCGFLDHEPLCKHDRYLGKRMQRGLFRASSGQCLNADLNGSYNIVRRAFPAAFDQHTRYPTHAQRINPQHMHKHLQTWATTME